MALQHNVGLGGACVVTMYRHGFPDAASLVVVIIILHTSHRHSQDFVWGCTFFLEKVDDLFCHRP